jgi:hypothetical protein
MRRGVLRALVVCLVAMAFTVPGSASSGDRSGAIGLPANIVVDDALADIVKEMLDVSPAFRRQCRDLGSMPRVRTLIMLADEPQPESTVRAQCVLTRYQYGTILAHVKVWSLASAPELIAHELEHVAEFAEGTNYRVLALHHPAAVWTTRSGHFETRRAIEAGELVARDMWRTFAKATATRGRLR